MPDSPAATPAGADAAALAGGSAPAFAELCRAPLVQALLAACGATACHLVGGALRDAALGLPTHDLDAVAAGHALGLGDPAGASHATPETAAPHPATADGTPETAIPCAGAVLDIWDRQDASLHDDLARRDFTV